MIYDKLVKLYGNKEEKELSIPKDHVVQSKPLKALGKTLPEQLREQNNEIRKQYVLSRKYR